MSLNVPDGKPPGGASDPPPAPAKAASPSAAATSETSTAPRAPQAPAGPAPASKPAPPPRSALERHLTPIAWFIGIGLLGCVALIVCAAAKGQLDASVGAAWTLGATAVSAAIFGLLLFARKIIEELIAAVGADGPPRFETHWGGLGGSTGGWSLSRSFALLIVLVFVLAALVAVVAEVKVLSGSLLKNPSAKVPVPETVSPKKGEIKRTNESGSVAASTNTDTKSGNAGTNMTVRGANEHGTTP